MTGPFAALQRIRSDVDRSRAGQRCELCAGEIGDAHSHIVDLETRSIKCACRPCALLFTREGAAAGRFRTVPDRRLAVRGFELSLGQWDALQIPVSMAFFLRSSADGDVHAFYPSPAGATESLLPLWSWADVEAANPVVSTAEPDVEAVLVRVAPPGFECFILPIDACYELVGHIRSLWRGFDGGREVRDRVAEFLDGLRRRAEIVDRG